MKRVEVIWHDAADVDAGPWVDRKDAPEHKPVIFHQVGYLYEVTKDEIHLTSCVGVDSMSARTAIPRGMVKKIVELTEGSPVKVTITRKRAK